MLLLFAASAAAQAPKNFIIVIGDGMGLTQVSSSLLTDSTSAFLKFPITGLSITCSADKLITDSAAGATALATGKRTNNRWISVAPDSSILKTVHEYALDQGMSAGAVVTSTISNATPAAFLSHGTDRKKEPELAAQLLDKPWDVIIGGGKKYFTPKYDSAGKVVSPDLLSKLRTNGYQVFEDADSLLAAKPENKFYALFDNEGLPSARKRTYTLADLTKSALRVMQQNSNGFILLVEGSQIDWALHDHLGSNFEAEMNDFNIALHSIFDFAKQDKNTLVVVTADHETGGLSINGGATDSTKLKYAFTTAGHTAAAVGVFSYGPGSEQFSGIYQNYAIGQKLIELIRKDKKKLKH